jgi:ornithine cyclodeaminase
MATGKKVEFLYLDEENMIKAGVLDMANCVRVTEEVFSLLGKGDYLLGGPGNNEHGQKIFFPKTSPFPNMPLAGPDRRFMAMMAYLGGRFNVAGEKWYGSNTANTQRGLPRSILMVMLNDPETCEPLALMSANLISAMRTGAVPGVGTKYLAKKDAKVVGLIGGGVINKACLLAIAETAKSLEEIVLYDIVEEKAKAFLEEMGAKLNLRTTVAKSTEEAISKSDIISIAASGPKGVDIKDEWLKPGSLLTMTAKGNVPASYLGSCRIVADNWKMHQAYVRDAQEIPGMTTEEAYNQFIPGPIFHAIDSGVVKESDIIDLGLVVNGEAVGRTSDDERILFVTSGIPAEDVGWGYEIYQRAKSMNLGQTLKLWDSAHWM